MSKQVNEEIANRLEKKQKEVRKRLDVDAPPSLKNRGIRVEFLDEDTDST